MNNLDMSNFINKRLIRKNEAMRLMMRDNHCYGGRFGF
jgi:hypothetical protein